MSKIIKEAYNKCEIEIINKGIYFWINRKDMGIESDYDNLAQVFDKYNPEKQKYSYELIPNTEFQASRRFVRNDLAGKN